MCNTRMINCLTATSYLCKDSLFLQAMLQKSYAVLGEPMSLS